MNNLIKIFVSFLLLVASCSAETPKEKTTQTAQVEDAAWVNLLEGDSLSLWRSHKSNDLPEGWTLKNGVLHFIKAPKSKGSDLFTKKDYFNFELKFEFNVAPKSNSGVKYRTKGNQGMEYQVIDDLECPDIKKSEHKAASLYDLIAAPETKKLKPAGEWNTARIVAHGNKIEHWLNGERVVSIKLGSPKWKEYFQKSKYKSNSDFAESPGPIFLQDHKDEVFYRNLLIKELRIEE